MNIIDAVKSGNPFRRKSKIIHASAWDCTSPNLNLSPADILADDWEVKEKKIEVTESQLDGILYNVLDEKNPDDKAAIRAIKSMLGF